MNPVLKGYLRLCRPPNLPTAIADIVAGLAIVGYFHQFPLDYGALALVFASVCLYAGGVVLNDVFDFELDQAERPERPIPSGLIPLGKARIFGFSLLLAGISMAGLVNTSALGLSFLLATAIVIYDIIGKKHAFFGPLNMGLCRSLNLLLGMAFFQDFSKWPYALVPLVFIFAVTLVSRGEVHGNNKGNVLFSFVLYAVVIGTVILLNNEYAVNGPAYLIFLIGFGIMVFLPLAKAYQDNTPGNIMKAVKAGVLSIILLDAAMAVGHASWHVGIGVLLLLPLSLLLAKVFAVT